MKLWGVVLGKLSPKHFQKYVNCSGLCTVAWQVKQQMYGNRVWPLPGLPYLGVSGFGLTQNWPFQLYGGTDLSWEDLCLFFCNYQINEWINLLKIKYAKYSKNFKQGAMETQRWEWVRQGSCSRRLVWIESLVVRWSCATPVRGLTCLGNSK